MNLRFSSNHASSCMTAFTFTMALNFTPRDRPTHKRIRNFRFSARRRWRSRLFDRNSNMAGAVEGDPADPKGHCSRLGDDEPFIVPKRLRIT